jgi:hypothetical protein
LAKIENRQAVIDDTHTTTFLFIVFSTENDFTNHGCPQLLSIAAALGEAITEQCR